MNIDKEEYLFHINDENQRRHMRRVLDFIGISLKNHSVTTTDFMEPKLIDLAESILSHFDQLDYCVEGGFDNAERNIIVIYPWYHDYQRDQDSTLRAFEITNNIEGLKHSHVLGSILGLGLVRDKIGDIGIFPDKILVTVLEEVYDYILINLRKIDRSYVDIRPVDPYDLGSVVEKGKTIDLIASSKRLDVLIAEVYNLSRSKAKSLIDSGLVKVNYSVETKSHLDIEEKDLVSVRGHGRFRLDSYNGRTKKDRLKFSIFQPD